MERKIYHNEGKLNQIVGYPLNEAMSKVQDCSVNYLSGCNLCGGRLLRVATPVQEIAPLYNDARRHIYYLSLDKHNHLNLCNGVQCDDSRYDSPGISVFYIRDNIEDTPLRESSFVSDRMKTPDYIFGKYLCILSSHTSYYYYTITRNHLEAKSRSGKNKRSSEHGEVKI